MGRRGSMFEVNGGTNGDSLATGVDGLDETEVRDHKKAKRERKREKKQKTDAAVSDQVQEARQEEREVEEQVNGDLKEAALEGVNGGTEDEP